jgi:hypothetical protein
VRVTLEFGRSQASFSSTVAGATMTGVTPICHQAAATIGLPRTDRLADLGCRRPSDSRGTEAALRRRCDQPPRVVRTATLGRSENVHRWRLFRARRFGLRHRPANGRGAARTFGRRAGPTAPASSGLFPAFLLEKAAVNTGARSNRGGNTRVRASSPNLIERPESTLQPTSPRPGNSHPILVFVL